MASFEAPRPSDEEEDEEEEDFKLPEKKEEKSWFSVNKCIVAALVLLFLGSLFFSGEFLFEAPCLKKKYNFFIKFLFFVL